MSAPLTADQAIALLREQPGAYRTPATLRTLAAQLDADASGKLTVLYSGRTTKNVWSSDVIDLMKDPEKHVRMINNRPATRI